MDLKSWKREVNAVVRALSPECRRRYGRQRLPHYREVAKTLDERFGDWALTRAGYLHGLFSDELHRLPESLVPREVLGILEERLRLRALHLQEGDLQRHSEILFSIRDARTVVLFVIEQLHHLDPTGRLAEWSRRFHLRPAEVPKQLPPEPAYLHDWDTERKPVFYRNVVAPAAKFFGLWHERSVIEDAALFYSKPNRFQELLSFTVKESDPREGECSRLRKLVEGSLKDLDPAPRVHWEWRHIGSIDRNFETKPASWRRQIHRAGFVTVVCERPEGCYLALQALHSRMRHRPTELRDWIGTPTEAGYQAIHTILVPPRDADVQAEAVAVRLVPAASDPARFLSASREHLERIEHRVQSPGVLDLRVYTPDGLEEKLLPGSSVLNFAYKVNKQWLAHLAGATVNRRPVDALHPLRPGDIVWLDVREKPIPLPRGWKSHVATGTATKIGKCFRQYYRPALMADGRNWLREQLLGYGVEVPEDDAELDDFLEEAAAETRHFAPKSPPTSRWLLKQLGILAAELRGEYVPFACVLNRSVVDKIVSIVERMLRGSLLVTQRDLQLPKEIEAKLTDVQFCGVCRPGRNQMLVGSMDGTVLTLHAVGASCGRDGMVVSRVWRSAQPQYFVVENSNRVGIAAEVLKVFQSQHVNLTDIAGIQLGPDWSILRVQTGYILSRQVEELRREIKGIDGVTRVLGPKDPRSALESKLPPRRIHDPLNWTKPAPYYCGGEITDDAYFYGMEEQLGVLRRAYEEILGPGATGSKSVWILGPRRVGKTSLIQAFRREITRTAFRQTITAYFEAAVGESWADAEAQIVRALLSRARMLADIARIEDLFGDPESIVECVDRIREVLDCAVVLVIDEAVGMLAGARERGELERLLKFRAEMQRRRGVLVVWVGPEGPARYLDTEVGQILQKAEPLRVKSLTREDVKKLLAAEKLGPVYAISLSRRLIGAVWEMTAGNPFLVSHLGREMWMQADRTTGVSVQYTMNLLDRARDEIFNLGVPFLDRIRGSRSADDELCRQVLLHLAQARDDSGRKPAGRSHSEILEGLGSTNGLDDRRLLEVLEDLQARGSVVCVPAETGRRWKVSPPMLADYLTYLNS